METIPKSECQKIGFIRKTHGVQGELVLEYEPEFEESVAEAERFFLEVDGLLVPFFVAEEGLRFKSFNSVLVQFDWIDSETQARRLVGNSAYLFSDEIVEEAVEDTASQFMNYRLQNEDGSEIGTVTAVDDYSGNVVFTLNADGKEILVPYNEELLLERDNVKKIVRLRLPEGLLDE